MAQESNLDRWQAGRPAERIMPERAEQLKQAVNRKPEPVQAVEPRKKEAERMEYKPTGLQRPPTLGGGSSVVANRSFDEWLRRREQAQEKGLSLERGGPSR